MAPPASGTRELRAFAFTVGVALLALGALQAWRDRPGASAALVAPAAVLMGLGLAAPRVLRPVHAGWMRTAHAMSRVTTPVFLGIFYFAVLTPMGLVLRLAGRSPLRRRRDAATYWVRRAPGARRSDLRRQF